MLGGEIATSARSDWAAKSCGVDLVQLRAIRIDRAVMVRKKIAASAIPSAPVFSRPRLKKFRILAGRTT